ncbi:hypothetical protein SEA_SEMPERFI_53 [Mycobacterium phage SemperFi]|uniref:Uncharacterized protein n=1 Tax=Mycobacterium phage Georgie2 TaxID=2743928 RepID=A0A7D5JJA6_9CAUD|nr:hypothetical protein PBI_SWEETIEPIE_52 [Mycobacterium phage SweetiePie]YP_010063859.1 hypothetical protein KIY84_gp52 [Mycobacterium phage Georgie2]AIS73814.1 hypothetical protein PBI_POWER_51 [Mycobacterium phage Power]ATN91897.1 hypothetical protein SEA_SNAPTAP_52 [Mycobacterium phage SnapTap]AXC33234.1 hypothetical protein SEA_CRUCIO_52 [Mycobacterium phage Crucio]AXQ52978.1 hypothetical protein SEA_QUEENBEESLY_52 [Mycobacterium phage QueenBeesly]QFG11853.1 hypothetical protein SEA_SEMP
MKKGTKVVIERDESKYPVTGTWKRFRGKKGVVTCEVRGGGPIEYGVSFSGGDSADAYFKAYEMTERK